LFYGIMLSLPSAIRALIGSAAPAARSATRALSSSATSPAAAGAPAAALPPPVRAGESPVAHETKIGDSYFWCSCGLSKKQPFCDGAHKGTGYKPVRIKAAAAETVWLCTCKATGNADTGRCDGSHLKARPAGGPAPVQALNVSRQQQ
jgi:CDGSH-type Zn-finger protein